MPGKAPTPNTAKPPSGALRTAAPNARVRDVFARFTACLRKNGLNLPEPGAKPSKTRRPIDTASPSFKAALAKCRSILTALRAKPAGAG